MKDKNEDKKKEPEIDYEKLYYQAMKENVLMKDKKISIELTAIEIDFLKSVMYEELYEVRDRAYFSMDNDDGEDNEAMKNLKPKTDEVLNSMVAEKRTMMETIVKKLRFEI
jgi:hypothetical protein